MVGPLYAFVQPKAATKQIQKGFILNWNSCFTASGNVRQPIDIMETFAWIRAHRLTSHNGQSAKI